MARRSVAGAIAFGALLGLGLVAAAAWHDLSAARTDLAEARSMLGVVANGAGARTAEGRHDSETKITAALADVAAAKKRVTGSPFVLDAGLLTR